MASTDTKIKITNERNQLPDLVNENENNRKMVMGGPYVWKNSFNTIIVSVGMLISLCALTSLNSTEKIQPRIMCDVYNGTRWTTVDSHYSHIYVSDEMISPPSITGYLSWLNIFAAYYVLIIGGHMNARRNKEENKTFTLHNLPKRKDSSFMTSLSCLKLNSKKEREKTMNQHQPI